MAGFWPRTASAPAPRPCSSRRKAPASLRAKTLYTGAGIYAAFIILFGFMHQPVGAAFLLFFAGYGITLFFSIGNSIIQTQSPDHLRGRLMGIWALVFGGSMPIGSFWMGVIAQRVGSGHALQFGGLLCAVGAWVVYLWVAGIEVKRQGGQNSAG